MYKFYRSYAWLHEKIQVHFHLLTEIAQGNSELQYAYSNYN